MKHKLTFFAVLMMAMAFSHSVKAYDVSYMLPNGIDLYFNIEGNHAVVTYPGQAENGCYWCGASTPWGSISIPDSVTYNGIKYPVTAIGEYAFYHCYDITSVTLPNTITVIGDHAFSSCESLSSIVLPNSITDLGNWTFTQSGLSSVSIPTSVTSIGNFTFSDCPLVSITIPNSVVYIGCNAFANCSNLESVSIGNSVTTIDTGAFFWCFNLHSIVLPNSLTTIRFLAFYNSGLNSVSFGNSVSTIEAWAFAHCPLYDPVTLPSTLLTIGDTAFLNARMLYYSGTATGSPWGALCVNGYVEDSLYYTSNAKDTLTGAKKEITSAIIPNTVVKIGRLAFEGCTDLSSVSMPDSLLSIGDAAFLGCSSLVSIVVPQLVDTLGIQTFSFCTSLQDIFFNRIEPPSMDWLGVFSGTPETVNVHIPCGTLDEYASVLSCFSNFVMPDFEYQFSAMSENNSKGSVTETSAPTCSSPAVVFATASEGYQFSHWSNGTTDNPLELMVYCDTYVTAFFNSVPCTPDSIFIYDTVVFHDTTYVPVHDTTYINIHDTTYITLTDTVTNIVYDTVTNIVIDTVTNTVYDTTVVFITDTLWLHDTVYVHDTVYIHDTIVVGLDEVEAINAKIYTSNGQIVVESGDGMPLGDVQVFDMMGRHTPSPLRGTPSNLGGERQRYQFDVPASGTYLVKIGNRPARKVVVIK